MLYNDGDKESKLKRNLIEAACAREEGGRGKGGKGKGGKGKGGKGKGGKGKGKGKRAGGAIDKAKTEKPEGLSATGGAGFKEGDTVESRHGGQGQWFGAKVTAAHGDGSCDLTYDDGDKEKKVLRHRIRRKGDKDRPTLTEGEVVDCRHGGGKKLFPGKIAKVHDDGLGNLSYDVLYNDGDKESKLKRNLIEASCS